MNETTVKPYQQPGSTKKQEVTTMFDNIAGTYDVLNHGLSAGIDFWWRRRTVKKIAAKHPKQILDVATGTADFAVVLARLKPDHITAVDISPNMIELAKKKIARYKLESLVTAQVADSELLPFEDNSFDAITVGFGVRNFGDLDKGLSELQRVLRPGGTLAVLEFSRPAHFPVKQLFGWYSRYIIPTIGRLVSRDKSAYSYLPSSVAAFPEGADFESRLKRVGLTDMQTTRLTFGVASIYCATKK